MFQEKEGVITSDVSFWLCDCLWVILFTNGSRPREKRVEVVVSVDRLAYFILSSPVSEVGLKVVKVDQTRRNMFPEDKL